MESHLSMRSDNFVVFEWEARIRQVYGMGHCLKVGNGCCVRDRPTPGKKSCVLLDPLDIHWRP